jgi:hypothetical protein
MSLEVYGIFSSTYYWVAMKKGHIAVSPKAEPKLPLIFN